MIFRLQSKVYKLQVENIELLIPISYKWVKLFIISKNCTKKKGYGNFKRQVALHYSNLLRSNIILMTFFLKKKTYQIQDPQGKSQQHQL